MKNTLLILSMILTFVIAGTNADAVLIGYVNNPTGNSVDWTNGVTQAGGVINPTLTFEGLSGSLSSVASNGMTFSQVAGMANITLGAGPTSYMGISATPSMGEGIHPSSNYVPSNVGPWYEGKPNDASFVISFATPVLGAGLFTIDAFTLGYPFSLAAYTGSNATGTLLGTYSSVQTSFQGDWTSTAPPYLNYDPNRLYYMGIISTENNIGSLKFSASNHGASGDTFGIDNIRTAALIPVTPVPEPASLLLFGIGLVGMSYIGRRKKK